MTTGHNKNTSNKYIAPMLAAFGITALIGIGMFALGLNAFFGKGIKSAEAAIAPQVDVTTASPEELQALVLEYQNREAQYLSELSQAANQLDQANAQIANYQSLLNQLQSAGVIRIDRNGTVTVNSSRGFFRNGDD